MSDLISRQAAIDIAYPFDDNERNLIDALEELPTADVRENVRGEWIGTTSGEHYKCSQCGTLAPIWIDESNSCEYDKDISEWLSDFCPNCGAQMRGTEE